MARYGMVSLSDVVGDWVNVTIRMTRKKILIGSFLPIIQITQTPEADPIGVFCNLKSTDRARAREVDEKTLGNPPC